MKMSLIAGLLVIVAVGLAGCASSDMPPEGEALAPADGVEAAPPAVPKPQPRGPVSRGGMMDSELNYGTSR